MNTPAGLRPRTVGEILDASFTLYRRRFWPLLLVATVFSVPTLVVAVAVSSSISNGAADTMEGFGAYYRALERTQGRWDKNVLDAYLETLNRAMKMNLVLYLTQIAQSFSRGATCVAAATVAWAAVRGAETPRAWDLVRTTLPRALPATFIWVLTVAISAACGICLPIPILGYAVLGPACAVLALERGNLETSVSKWSSAPARFVVAPFAATIDACGRCFRLTLHGMTLVRGSTLIFFILAFVTIVVLVASLAAGIIWKSFAVGFVVNHYAEVLFLPVIGTACALWYLDVRVRREGIDLG